LKNGEKVLYEPPGWDPKTYKPSENRKSPGLLQRGSNFAKAVGEHRAAGYPQATDEQVAERFAICQTCVGKGGFFKSTGEGSGQCTHVQCGCNMRNVGSESMITPNKLRWAEQKCPIGKWDSVVPVVEKIEEKKKGTGMKIRTHLFGVSPIYERCARVLEHTAEMYMPGVDFEIIRVDHPDKDVTIFMKKGRTSHDTNNALKTKYQMELVQDSKDGDQLCLMDADTMITGDLSEVWDDDFDLAVTDKENREVKAPINTGVLFVRVSDETKAWFQQWYNMVLYLLQNPEKLKQEKKVHLGINQSALGMLMRQPHELDIKLIPCRLWNSTTITWPLFSEETKVVHILGSLRQCIFFRQLARIKNVNHLSTLWRKMERECKEKVSK